MKLKFRADKEDWIIFLAFALFLFFVIAIGISNISTFASTGNMSGLNPLPALAPDLIVDTLIIYFLCLGGLLFSVKSYFFESEKGFGIATEKKDKGYSRWAKEREIKDELEMVEIKQSHSKVAGVPIILNSKEMWVDNSEYHSLVIGATGSGKTQTVILPQVHSLAKARESMIITDPKGEIYEKTSNMLRAKGYQVLLLNIRNPQNGNSWNPMTLPYQMYKNGNQDKAIELLDDLALNILYDESNKNADPFWEKTSADYFSGVALGLFEDGKAEEININSISLMTTVGEEKFGGSTYIKEYFSDKDPGSAAAIDASSTIMAPNETKLSILSVFKQKVKLFSSRDNLSEMLSYSDIDLESIGEKPTAVFVVIQDEKKTYHSLVTIFLKQVYETLIATAQKHGGKLPVRTNFLLDEFANMPPLKDVTTMITAARSRGIRFTMIIQNFAQLDSVYGEKEADTIRGNCGNIIYLITTELKALEEISKMCGEVKSKKDDKTASTPLVTISDLQRMKQFEVIILRMRKLPFKTKFTPYFELDWGKRYPKADYPVRLKREVHTFDIKEFVKNSKKKKLLEMMNSTSIDDNNSSVGSGSSPSLNNIPRPTIMPYSKEESDFKDFLSHNVASHPSTAPFSPMDMPSFEKENFSPESTPSFMNQSTISNSSSNSLEDDDLGFDVDELVRKIDAKIAELEEEERREKEEQAKKNAMQSSPVVSHEELSEGDKDKEKERTSKISDATIVEQPEKGAKEKLSDTSSVSGATASAINDIKVISNIQSNKSNESLKESKMVEPSRNQANATYKTDTKQNNKSNLDLNDNIDDDDFFDDFFDN